MPRQTSQSPQAKSPGQKSKKSNPKASPAQSGGRRRAPEPQQSSGGIVDDKTRRNIAGIIFIVLGCALLVMVTRKADALVTSVLSDVMHLVFGIGAYILPIFLLLIGIGFLVRSSRATVPARVPLGLLILFIAILFMAAIFTPGVDQGAVENLFAQDNLVGRGGYIGAGCAWLGVTLFGRTISAIIAGGLGVIGLLVVGISLSRIVEQAREASASIRFSGRNDRPARGRALPESEHAAQTQLIVAPMDAPASETQVLGASCEKTPLSQRLGGLLKPEKDVPPVRARGKEASPKRPAAVPDEPQANFVPIQIPDTSSAPTMVFDGSADRFAADPKPMGAGIVEAAEAAASEQNAPEGEAVPLVMTRRLGKRAVEAEKSSQEKGAKGKKASEKKSAVEKAAKRKPSPNATPTPDQDFVLPPMDLLMEPSNSSKDSASEAELAQTAANLQKTLEDFGLMVTVRGWVAGPTVTLFKIELPAGVRVSRIMALNNDIALALAAPGVRIFAPIPGTNFVGIEVPNAVRRTVFLSDVLSAAKPGPLQVAIGEDVEGNKIVSDLAKMPHLLIGGTTGSGKSVCINSMIMSILMRATPAEVRFIMVDPKRVEFSLYNGIPHLYVPVVTEPKEAASALSWGVAEMERRLKVFSSVGARNIGQYNAKVQSGELEEQAAEELPYIVIIIDELADLMMNVGKEVEYSISRIAQLARAAGIHLIVATQRPSANIVTGLIKANITNRIACNVASSIDSRVILDTPGAENLIGDGDLLLSKPELGKPQRIQGCFVSEDEINAVVEHLKAQGTPEYHSEILKTNLITLGDSMPDGSGGSCTSDDPLIWEAAEIVVSSGFGSTSNIQRRLKVGYARAGRIMDMLEEKGVVGPPNGSKPRDVLVDAMELETLKAFEAHDGE